MSIKNESEMNMLIGKNIRKYRNVYNATIEDMPQRELARLIGVSTPLIGALESRKCKQGVSIYNLYKISKVLNVPIEKFFEEEK